MNLMDRNVAVTVIVSLVEKDGDPEDDEDIALVTEICRLEDLEEVAGEVLESALDETHHVLGVAEEL